MIGDERKRYCSECKLNVYNLSEMTRADAESFLINAEGRVCVKFYRRADGSVLTKDCPVGRQAFEKRMLKKAKAFFALCTGIFGGLVAYVQFQPGRVNQKHIENSVTSVENNLPVVPVYVEKNEPEEIRNDYETSSVGMIFTRVKPEKQKKKSPKFVNRRKSRR